MKVTVVGIESVDYVSKKTGQPVQGATIHYVRVPHGNKVNSVMGRITGTEFVSARDPLISTVSKLNLDTEYEFALDYDGRFTSLVDIRPVKA